MVYNIGDRISIVSKWNEYTQHNDQGLMDKWLGQNMTIRDIDGLFYLMEEDKHENAFRTGWYWNEHCIAGLAKEDPDTDDILGLI